MTCNRCGKEVGANERFCSNCGNQIEIPQQEYYQPQDNSAYYQPQYQQYQQPYQQPQYQQGVDENKTYAVVSFGCGIASFFFGIVCSILAIIFANLYNKGIGYKDPKNEKYAKIGKILGTVSLALFCVAVFFYIFIFAGIIGFSFLDF